jgi:hypothetical protein
MFSGAYRIASINSLCKTGAQLPKTWLQVLSFTHPMNWLFLKLFKTSANRRSFYTCFALVFRSLYSLFFALKSRKLDLMNSFSTGLNIITIFINKESNI